MVLAPGCFSIWRPQFTTQDWRLVRLPDAQGGLFVEEVWLTGTSSATEADGLEWFDGSFWICNDGGLAEVDLVGGGLLPTPVPCDMFAVVRGTLQVDPYNVPDGDWQIFDSADAVRAGAPSQLINRFEWPYLRKAAGLDGVLHATWFSDTSVDVMDPGGGLMRSYDLEGFDAWIAGVSASQQQTLAVLDDGRNVDDALIRLYDFDPNTGAQLGTPLVLGHRLEEVYGGLWCGAP